MLFDPSPYTASMDEANMTEVLGYIAACKYVHPPGGWDTCHENKGGGVYCLNGMLGKPLRMFSWGGLEETRFYQLYFLQTGKIRVCSTVVIPLIVAINDFMKHSEEVILQELGLRWMAMTTEWGGGVLFYTPYRWHVLTINMQCRSPMGGWRWHTQLWKLGRLKKNVNNLGFIAVSRVFMELFDFHDFHNLEVSSNFYENVTREKPCIWTWKNASGTWKHRENRENKKWIFDTFGSRL